MATRIPFRGFTLDAPTIAAFLLTERLLGYPLTIMQGSWSTGVAASAGTHAAGGAVDVSISDASGALLSPAEQARILRALRQSGFAAWRRTPAAGFVFHAHCIVVGDPLVSPAAAAQLVQWADHLNGLADHGPDDDPVDAAAGRPAVIPPGGHVPRTMYDAVTVANIPAGAVMVAGYVDGNYANWPAMAGRFPNAVHVPIATKASTNAALVLDVETGDATPAQAPGWVLMRRAAGVDPSVYCNTSTWPDVKQAFAAAGVAPPHYWVAQYDGDPTIPAGAVAKQHTSAGPYDLSSVADVWPGIDTGADMPLTPADLADISAAVWNHTELNAANNAPVRMGAVLRYSDFVQLAQTRQLTAQLGALSAAVTALSKGGGITAEQITAAAQAGATAALAELGHALDGTH